MRCAVSCGGQSARATHRQPKYLVEAAAACLDYGLQTTPSSITLKPVAWSLVAKAIKSHCPAVTNVLDKLCGSVGQKYFSLLGTSSSGRPELVVAKLDSLITGPHHAAVVHLLACIYHTEVSKQPDQSSRQSTQTQPPSLPSASITVRAAKQSSSACV